MRYRPSIHCFLLSALGFGIVLVSGCAKKDPPAAEPTSQAGIAGMVNGEPITLTEYYDHMGVKQTAQVMSQNGPTELRLLGTVGLQSMQDIVDQKVLLQMAKEQGVTPTEADIDAELKLQTELRPDYSLALKDQGMTDEMIRHDILVGLAKEHLIMKGVTVEPAEIDEYIKENPDKFREPEKATLSFVQVNAPELKAKVDAALARGASFASVVQQFSQSPGAKESGGLYSTQVVSQMPKVLQQFVKGSSVHGVSNWLPNGKSFLKFTIDKKTPAAPRTPTTAQRKLIRRGLAIQKGSVKNDFNHQFLEKLRQSKIDVSVPYLKEPWSRTWNQLSAPSTGAVPPPAGK